MTYPILSSVDLDPRRRRILMRARRRGMREMDVLLGRFCDARLSSLEKADVEALERLLDVPDREAFAWLTGGEPLPGEYDTALFAKLKDFHTHARPLHA